MTVWTDIGTRAHTCIQIQLAVVAGLQVLPLNTHTLDRWTMAGWATPYDGGGCGNFTPIKERKKHTAQWNVDLALEMPQAQ